MYDLYSGVSKLLASSAAYPKISGNIVVYSIVSNGIEYYDLQTSTAKIIDSNKYANLPVTNGNKIFYEVTDTLGTSIYVYTI